MLHHPIFPVTMKVICGTCWSLPSYLCVYWTKCKCTKKKKKGTLSNLHSFFAWSPLLKRQMMAFPHKLWWRKLQLKVPSLIVSYQRVRRNKIHIFIKFLPFDSCNIWPSSILRLWLINFPQSYVHVSRFCKVKNTYLIKTTISNTTFKKRKHSQQNKITPTPPSLILAILKNTFQHPHECTAFFLNKYFIQ